MMKTEDIKHIMNDKQFYWWMGHVCVVCNGLFYFCSVLSLQTSIVYYRLAYIGAILSYAVVISNTKNRELDMLLCDENVHYLALAFYWYSYQPITVTLIPFFIFSLFHTLSYFRLNLLSLFQHPILSQIDNRIRSFTDNNHSSALYYVAYIEVILIMSRLILGVLTLTTSVLALIVFIHFLRLRYYLSPYTQQAVLKTIAQLDQWFICSHTNNNFTLNILSNVYISLKKIISRYAVHTTLKPS